jgi:hypothetical protein
VNNSNIKPEIDPITQGDGRKGIIVDNIRNLVTPLIPKNATTWCRNVLYADVISMAGHRLRVQPPQKLWDTDAVPTRPVYELRKTVTDPFEQHTALIFVRDPIQRFLAGFDEMMTRTWRMQHGENPVSVQNYVHHTCDRIISGQIWQDITVRQHNVHIQPQSNHYDAHLFPHAHHIIIDDNTTDVLSTLLNSWGHTHFPVDLNSRTKFKNSRSADQLKTASSEYCSTMLWDKYSEQITEWCAVDIKWFEQLTVETHQQ